jgi:manganese transport protein
MPTYKEVAVALDFTDTDKKTLLHALHIGGKNAHYFLIHSIESAGAVVMGADIRDGEHAVDKATLNQYILALTEMGYRAEAIIGYGSPRKAIPLLVEEKSVDILVMGAHGHTLIKDLIFGATVDAVRHSVKIPVLVVR